MQITQCGLVKRRQRHRMAAPFLERRHKTRTSPTRKKASTKAYTNKLYHVSATRLEFHIHQHHIASPTWLISTRQQQNITQRIRQQIQAIAEQELEDKDKTTPEPRANTRSNFSAAAFLALI